MFAFFVSYVLRLLNVFKQSGHWVSHRSKTHAVMTGIFWSGNKTTSRLQHTLLQDKWDHPGSVLTWKNTIITSSNMLQQWKTPACTTRKSLLDTEIEVMSCVSIQTVFWLDVCQDQWSSWGISGLCFFIQGWPNLWINPLIDWKKPHWMLSVVKTKKKANPLSNTIILDFSGLPGLWWITKLIIFEQKERKKKLHYEHMHTVNLKLCPKSLDFYFKVLPKYLAATRIAKRRTPTARNTGFGYMTGADAILGTGGPSHACECCYMCVCSLEEKAFYVFQHVISSPALPSQSRCCCFLVDMWETRDSCMVRSTAIFN